MTLILQRYKIEVTEEPQFAAETFAQRKERILSARPGITTTYVPSVLCPIRLRGLC